MTCLRRQTAEPVWTMWQTTAVEGTFSNVTNARKHLIKQNTWMITSSPILERRRHTNVHNAANHFHGLVNLEPTWWFTLERNCTSVHNAANHSIGLMLWNSICSLIPGISCTLVNNAANHLVKLDIWKDTCSLILGRSHISVYNATTQPLELVI